MIETEINIRTADGEMETFIVYPEREGPHPVVIFLMDAAGIRDELRLMASRLATAGYYVMLPNLYYRGGAKEIGPFPSLDDEEAMAPIWGYIATATRSAVMADCEALLAHARTAPEAANGPVGIMGYCLTGPYALVAAGYFAGKVAAAASIYGVAVVTDQPDSPHVTAQAGNAELYAAFSEIDDFVPSEEYETMRTYFAANDVRGEVELYRGVEHGFAFPERHCYDRSSAERHWERLHALFRRNLYN
ncbi:dienelactone hydrolase family protein [Novosphingobium colocasiae]|uniref:Hydrolase n=1 Tax=Novosphingobium colocasiae TaxID=1256513 RepID=A0A918UK10_9SPHN|nr:dienelactone hydrolase family protein [Novosphingobium colocasiae]GGZ16100.1 hydrolase [Novosphingobium colocasiae]